MANQTEIANQALARVGAKLIFDIDDTESKNARVVKNIYSVTFEELARIHKWNCLKARSDLAQLSTAPDFGWDYQYQLPTDCLLLCTVNGLEINEREDDYEIEGRKILTDAETCQITYIANQTDSNEWDSAFISAFVVLLAAKIATSIRQDEGMGQKLMEEYERITLPRAKRIDGNERKKTPHDPARDSSWVHSRSISTNG
jgi:hypothetical protein